MSALHVADIEDFKRVLPLLHIYVGSYMSAPLVADIENLT